jgi:short-subunit dehydrogenase
MQNKVVIITGGTSGIGKALAFEFGNKGSKIVITGRNESALSQTITELQKNNIDCLGLCLDVSKEADNETLAVETIKKYKQIDVLINNAGISMRALFSETTVEVIRQVMNINFYGAVYATKACLPYITAQKGSIVGISSIAGWRGLPGRTGYSASKFALQGFLEALRTELLYEGVHVLTACPGFTASNIRKTALAKNGAAQGESPRDEQKMMSAEEVATHIYKAVTKRKKFLLLTTQGIFTVWLNKFFPSLMDKLVYNAMAKEPDSPLKKK